MIETEESKKVSNEQLFIDIDLTHREAEAYSKLMDGFAVLMELPENKESGKSNIYKLEYYKYSQANSDCVAFVKQLYELKAERGLRIKS